MKEKIESRIVITHATELKPGAKYLIAFEEGSFDPESIDLLRSGLTALGVTDVVIIMTVGKPTEVMKIVEQEA